MLVPTPAYGRVGLAWIKPQVGQVDQSPPSRRRPVAPLPELVWPKGRLFSSLQGPHLAVGVDNGSGDGGGHHGA